MKRVFVDTSTWINLADETEPNHRNAENCFTELQKEGGKLFTSNYVLDETLTRLLYDRSIRIAEKFYRQIAVARDQKDLVVFWVDESVANDAWEAFVKFAEHKLSFTDATSYTLMKRYRLDEIFAFDDDFAKIGLKVRP